MFEYANKTALRRSVVHDVKIKTELLGGGDWVCCGLAIKEEGYRDSTKFSDKDIFNSKNPYIWRN